MITLRTFIFSVCGMLFLVLVGVHYSQSNLVFSQRFQEIEAAHLFAVKEYSSAILNTKKYLLGALASDINRRGAIGTLFLDRHNVTSNSQLKKEISDLTKRSGVGSLEIFSLNSKSSFGQMHFEEARNGKSSFSIVDENGVIELVHYFPVKLFEKAVAVGIMRLSLNDNAAKEVGNATGASVRFQSLTKNETTSFVLLDETNIPLVGVLVSKSIIKGITHQANSGFVVIGALGLIAALLAIYLTLHFGFARDFEIAVSALDHLASEIESGNVHTIRARRFSIRELSRLSQKLSTLSTNIVGFQAKIANKSRMEATGEQAEQLTHDLKGPVAALSMAMESDLVKIAPAAAQNVASLMDRIRSVADGLKSTSPVRGKDSHASTKEHRTPENLVSLVEQIVIEKTVQYSDFSHLSIRLSGDLKNKQVFSNVERTDFLRVLSNVVDNSVEACGEFGAIDVKISLLGHNAVITVSDNGAGIPKEHLTRFGERGFSFGKEKGSGLGVWHALERVKNWQGSLTVVSEVGKGTEITISLPLSEPTLLEVSEVRILENAQIVICDNEEWVHDVWSTRLLQTFGSDILNQIRHCYSSDSLIGVMATIRLSHTPFVLLCDYDLGSSWNGLDLISQLNLQNETILVTSHDTNELVRRECSLSGIRLLPKNKITSVNFVVSPDSNVLTRGRKQK